VKASISRGGLESQTLRSIAMIASTYGLHRFLLPPAGHLPPHGAGFVAVAFFAIDLLNAEAAWCRLQRFGLRHRSAGCLLLNDQMRLRFCRQFRMFFLAMHPQRD